MSTLDGKIHIDKKYYISSLLSDDFQHVGTYIRDYWAIENRQHWHLDVTFGEDACRARKPYSATNLNTLRSWL